MPVRLVYNTYYPTDGVDAQLAPILFLHGIGASKENWGDIPQNVANATKRMTIAIDAMNHGDSEWREGFSFDKNSDDLLQFMEIENISRAILVGHSMGGITSMRATLKQPEKIEKLVVEDMFIKPLPQEILNGVASYFTNALKAIKAVPDDMDDEEKVKDFIMEHIHSNLPPEVQEKRRGDRKSEDSHILMLKKDNDGRYAFKANLEAIEKYLCNSEVNGNTEVVGKYEGPAFFIYGKLSPFKVDSEMEHIRQYFPNAVFEGIEEATHTVHSDSPAEFTDAIVKFLL